MIQGGNARAGRVSFTRPLVRAWHVGVRTFQKHPLLIKSVTSGIGFAAGDALTQFAMSRKVSQEYDWPRTIAMGTAGLCLAGPLGYGLIVWMEGNIMTSAPLSGLAITTKVTLDQVFGGILWQLALISINEPYRKAATGVLQKGKHLFSSKDSIQKVDFMPQK